MQAHAKLFFLIAFILIPLNGSGGTHQLDYADNIFVLKQQLKESKTDQEKMKVLLQIAKFYLNTQPDSSLQYAKKAQSLANINKNERVLAKSENLIGENFMLQGIYSRAIELLLQANAHFEITNDENGLAENFLTLGNAYQYSKQLDIAKNYYEAALKIFERISNEKGLANAYGNIGHVYEKKEIYNEALAFQQKALQIYQQLDMPQGMAAIYDNLGSIYEDLSQYDSAYYYFNASAELYQSVNNSAGLIISLNNIGDVFRKRGDYKNAIIYTRKSLSLARKLNQKYQMRSAFRDLSKLYEGIGDFETAYLFMDSTYTYTGDIFNEQIADQIANLQTLYETQRKEQEIALLESEKKAELLLRYLFIAGIMLILVIAYIIIKNQTLRIKKDKELLQNQQRIHEAELHNTQLKEKSLEIDLENRKLKEEQLNKELAIKDKEMTSRALHIIQKNKLLKELRGNIQEIKKIGNGSVKKTELNKLDRLIDYSFSFDKDWEDFQRSFEQVHADFFNRLQTEYPNLTASELRLCALMRLNLNSKDMATILGISQDSLRISRYRLRKKFDLPKGSNLPNHIMQFG